MTTDGTACWCGQRGLESFSPSYARCSGCDTIVSLEVATAYPAHVADEGGTFHGRESRFSPQERPRGLPTIRARARADLPERCLYWLRTLLRFRLPPARLMEVGNEHSGFTALLRWAGFDATGLEIIPGVASVAREAFDVPVLLGPVEDQRVEPGSLDVVALMGVLEHLRDPVETLRRCLDMLKADGILLIQTPCFDDSRAHRDLAGRTGRLLEVLPPRAHHYLFGRRSVGALLGRLGAGHIAFEPPPFADHDMLLVASRVPLRTSSGGEIDLALSRTTSGRMVQALVDLRRELDEVKGRHAVPEAEGAAHLGIIQEPGGHLAALASEHERLAAERDDLRAESVAQERQLQVVLAHLRALQRLVSMIQARRGYRILRRLGFCKWFEEAVGQAIPGPDPPVRLIHHAPSPTRPGDDHDHR